MSGKSFYDLDYIIEINEQRLEQYNGAYETITQKLTNIIVIYSAMAIFLIPIVRMVFWGENVGWIFRVCFGVFALLFATSCFYTVRLILPNVDALLKMPKIHYNGFREEYEKETDDSLELENLMKASYIKELELALQASRESVRRKRTFYAHALIFSLWSILPYLLCFGIYVANLKDDVIQKIEIVNKPICK